MLEECSYLYALPQQICITVLFLAKYRRIINAVLLGIKGVGLTIKRFFWVNQMFKVHLIFLITIVLGGCAVRSGPLDFSSSAVDPVVSFLNAERRFMECSSSAAGETIFVDSTLRSVLLMGESDPEYLRKLSDKSPLPPNIKQKFIEWHPKILTCRSEFLDAARDADPRIVQMYLDTFSKSDERAIKVLNDEFANVAQLNNYSRTLINDYKSERSRIGLLIDAEMTQRRVAAEQQKALMTQQILQSWSETQRRNNERMLNLYKPPIETSCYRTGNWINCTTR